MTPYGTILVMWSPHKLHDLHHLAVCYGVKEAETMYSSIISSINSLIIMVLLAYGEDVHDATIASLVGKGLINWESTFDIIRQGCSLICSMHRPFVSKVIHGS